MLDWRALDQGVFEEGDGPAYAAWEQWPGNAAQRTVAAAILAANAHDKPEVAVRAVLEIRRFMEPATKPAPGATPSDGS